MSSQIHPDQPEDATAEGAQHAEPSRRSVLYGAAGLAGAGLAATAIAGTLAAPAVAAVGAAPKAHPGEASPAGPVIVHVRDVRSGEMDVFAGESKTRLRDPGLAARLARSVR